MPTHVTRIPEARPLTNEERELIRWLIEHGTGDVADLLSQLARATVIFRCGCGCASIDLAIGSIEEEKTVPMELVADFAWKTKAQNLCGAYLFTRRGRLAGLDLWSIDGAEVPGELPNPDTLFSYASLQKG
jgi:hypothetical protein